jgi:hypothetical protein
MPLTIRSRNPREAPMIVFGAHSIQVVVQPQPRCFVFKKGHSLGRTNMKALVRASNLKPTVLSS